jgi:aspartate 1-decarboxylase
MLLTILKSKLHSARVTAANVDYQGSLGVSRELMDAVGLLPFEKVLVANIENGERLETYVIEELQPGQIVLNGAAAHRGSIGDRVIVMAFAQLSLEEARKFAPSLAVLNEVNEILSRS